MAHTQYLKNLNRNGSTLLQSPGQVTISGQGIPNVNFTNKPLVIVSDDFSAPTLKTPLWTNIDPLNDSTITIVGSGTKNASLSIFVPGTTQHDF